MWILQNLYQTGKQLKATKYQQKHQWKDYQEKHSPKHQQPTFSIKLCKQDTAHTHTHTHLKQLKVTQIINSLSLWQIERGGKTPLPPQSGPWRTQSAQTRTGDELKLWQKSALNIQSIQSAARWSGRGRFWFWFCTDSVISCSTGLWFGENIDWRCHETEEGDWSGDKGQCFNDRGALALVQRIKKHIHLMSVCIYKDRTLHRSNTDGCYSENVVERGEKKKKTRSPDCEDKGTSESSM